MIRISDHLVGICCEEGCDAPIFLHDNYNWAAEYYFCPRHYALLDQSADSYFREDARWYNKLRRIWWKVWRR